MNKIILTLGLHSSSIRIFTWQTQSILLNPNHSWQSLRGKHNPLWNGSLHCYRGKKNQHTRNNNNKLLSWQPHKGSLYYSRTARQPGHLKLLPILPEQLATTISKTYSVFAPIYMICTLCMQMYARTQPRFFTLFPLYVTLVLQWDFTLKHVKYSFSMLRV